jgi:hypothetical protein
MDERRAQSAADEERRHRRKRRAKRGLMAGYVHELSARHGTPGREAERSQAAVADARSG